MEFEGKGMDVFQKLQTQRSKKIWGYVGLLMGKGFSLNSVRYTNLKKIICILK